MRSIRRRTTWLSHVFAVAAMLVGGVAVLPAPVQAGYELPPGERITNLPAIPRNMPQKEAYENYDPVIGRNFDIKNFWMRADLRVRPEFRNGVCFGGGAPTGGACNGSGAVLAGANTNTANQGRGANDFYVQQWVRLGIGYDLSPDVNFYMEIIDARNWGSNGNPNNAGNAGDPLNHNCGATGQSATGTTVGQANCTLGVRAAYVLMRNLGGVQGLSAKVGRQYLIFGNHSLFGHFDWANTGYSHDGIMLSYSTKSFDSYLGWFRQSETDLLQGSPVGSVGSNIAGCNTTVANSPPGANCTAATRAGTPDGGGDADMFIFYNQIKSVPGFLIEPYYVLYLNNLSEQANSAQGLGTAKFSNQVRHMIGNRIEMRKGGFDLINETAYQFGQMADGLCAGAACGAASIADNQRNVHINAWATRNWVGYTFYQHKWKPRVAINFDYASGDDKANCAQAGQRCSSGNTFENFFPTNHIHMGYMDVMAWKNMIQPAFNFQFRPTERDHFEFWYNVYYLANKKDNWYRASQGVYSWSKANNTERHIGDEADFTWTRMFADGKVALQATYGHLFTGAYIQKNLGVNSDQSWGYLSLWMNF